MRDWAGVQPGRFQNIDFGRGFIVILEKLILDVFDRSWRGPWDRFGVILDAFWGLLGCLAAFWRRFGCLLRSCGGPKGALEGLLSVF